MTTVNYYSTVDDDLLGIVMIGAVYQGKWVFCQHAGRTSLEIPGGHRELGENILHTAERELYEETGALSFRLYPVCVYSVISSDEFNGRENFGMLYYAEITEKDSQLRYEIDKNCLLNASPEEWTYPDIQPYLLKEIKRRIPDTPPFFPFD